MNKKRIYIISAVLFQLGMLVAAVCRHPEASAPTQAYLDPSTGAMIISAIVGIFATIALGMKTFWYKLSAPWRKKKRQSTPTPPEETLKPPAKP